MGLNNLAQIHIFNFETGNYLKRWFISIDRITHCRDSVQNPIHSSRLPRLSKTSSESNTNNTLNLLNLFHLLFFPPVPCFLLGDPFPQYLGSHDPQTPPPFPPLPLHPVPPWRIPKTCARTLSTHVTAFLLLCIVNLSNFVESEFLPSIIFLLSKKRMQFYFTPDIP